MDIQLIGEEQNRSPAEVFHAETDLRQLPGAFRVVVPGDEFGALPDPTQLVEPAPEGRRRDLDAALRLHLNGEGGTTPTHPAPAKSRRSFVEQSQQRAAQTWRQRRGALPLPPGLHQLVERAGAISFDDAVNARTRTEQHRGDLRRGVAGGREQQDVERQQVAVAGASQFKEHFSLLRVRQLN